MEKFSFHFTIESNLNKFLSINYSLRIFLHQQLYQVSSIQIQWSESIYLRRVECRKWEIYNTNEFEIELSCSKWKYFSQIWMHAVEELLHKALKAPTKLMYSGMMKSAVQSCSWICIVSLDSGLGYYSLECGSWFLE